jgi:hypothetical protein
MIHISLKTAADSNTHFNGIQDIDDRLPIVAIRPTFLEPLLDQVGLFFLFLETLRFSFDLLWLIRMGQHYFYDGVCWFYFLARVSSLCFFSCLAK